MLSNSCGKIRIVDYLAVSLAQLEKENLMTGFHEFLRLF